jgi:exonuclease SbcD
MKLLSLADLHLGKTIGGFSLLEEQADMLKQCEETASAEHVDAVLLAGDIYDRAVPPAEATALFGGFLGRIASMGLPLLAIAGNHDSPVRLQFADGVFARQNIYMAGSLPQDCRLLRLTLTDAFGPVEFVFLPYFHPFEAGETSTQAAVAKVLAENGLLPAPEDGLRRVLLTHFFVTDGGKQPVLSQNEETCVVGNIDNVDVSLFGAFTYTALGHIHTPQRIGSSCWYAGSPLRYDFTDRAGERGMMLVELGASGSGPDVTFRAVHPLRTLRRVRGTFEELISPGSPALTEGSPDDYLQVMLTDRVPVLDPMDQLRRLCPHTVQVIPEPEGAEPGETGPGEPGTPAAGRERTPRQFFEDFYRTVEGGEITEDSSALAGECMDAALKDGENN